MPTRAPWRRLHRVALRTVAEAVALRRRLAAGRRVVREADVAELRASICSLPLLEPAASGPEAIWSEYRRRFREDILTRDARRFLRWPVLHSMYKRDAPYVAEQLAHLKTRPDWAWRWRPAVRESPVGDPRPFLGYRSSSGNLLDQAYHLCRFEDLTGVQMSGVDFILEFGGGYGALCRLVWALGFQGTYVIFDFPEFSALQQFYLGAHGLPLATASRPPHGPGIVTVSTLGELDEVLARRPSGPAVLVALWSLSEAPLALREAVVGRVGRFEGFAVGYQLRFGDVDNVEWFRAARRRLGDDIDWHEVPLPQRDGSVRHLFGVRRSLAAAR